MDLNSVILFVNDLAAAVAFCRDLLGLKEIFTDESSTVLGLGSSVLVLHRSDIGHPSPESRFSGTVWPNCEPGMAAGRHALRFEVEDPDALHERLAASGVHVLEPRSTTGRAAVFWLPIQRGVPSPSPVWRFPSGLLS